MIDIGAKIWLLPKKDKYLVPYYEAADSIMKATGDAGTVYIIACPSMGRYKIGFTAFDVGHRFQTMKTGSPAKLELVGYFPGSKYLESRLHRIFKESRSHLEWFNCTPASDRLFRLVRLISKRNHQRWQRALNRSVARALAMDPWLAKMKAMGRPGREPVDIKWFADRLRLGIYDAQKALGLKKRTAPIEEVFARYRRLGLRPDLDWDAISKMAGVVQSC